MAARVLSVICVLLATATALATTRAPPTSTSAPPPTSTIPPALATTRAPPTNTSTSPPTSTIPPGYTYYPATGSYYKYHTESLEPWDVANTTCASEGAHLVVLNNAEEADIVARIVSDALNDFYVTWLGLRDYRTGGVRDWRTVHGEPVKDVFNVWANFRPFNYKDWSCSFFLPNNKRLYDLLCLFKLYFVCEISQTK